MPACKTRRVLSGHALEELRQPLGLRAQPGRRPGWAVVNANGTGDLQATFCFHVLGMGGGAGRSSVDIFAWHLADGVFVIGPASDPASKGPHRSRLKPGHYNAQPGPGVNPGARPGAPATGAPALPEHGHRYRASGHALAAAGRRG